MAGCVIVTALLCHLNEFCLGVFGTSRQILKKNIELHLVSSISRDREEEHLNYWPTVPSVSPQMTQVKILKVCLTVRPEVTWHVDREYS